MSISDSTAFRYTMHDPDVRLMLAVRGDDANAFEELMLRYQDRLVNVLEHLVQQRDLAEDLAQDVFLRIYRSRKSYVPGAKFSTWLFTIANNVASNARRSQARRKEVRLAAPADQSQELPTMDGVAVAASGQMPHRLLDKEELRYAVRAAIGTLNERQRMAVLLNKFENMSYEEIATAMELTPKAIKSLLSRARGNLKAALEPYLHRGESVQAGLVSDTALAGDSPDSPAD
ncbi:MAG: sigma-70 family RNA polymerase sigma factor [Pirellulales bacterium]|nr:sigma-70 family RNA polymerase sigma factor [Pirellulales bacterium]